MAEFVVDGNTVGLWHMEQTGTEPDVSPNGFDMLILAGSLVPGVYNNAIDFAFAGGGRGRADIGAWVFPQMTFETWIATTHPVGNKPIMRWGDGSMGLFYNNAGSATFQVTTNMGSFSAVGTTPINDGFFHHIAGVYNGTECMIFIDDMTTPNTSVPATGNIVTPPLGTFVTWTDNEFSTNKMGAVIEETRISDIARYPIAAAPGGMGSSLLLGLSIAATAGLALFLLASRRSKEEDVPTIG